MNLSKNLLSILLCLLLYPAYGQQLDPNLTPSLVTSRGLVHAVERQSDGTMYVAGDFQMFADSDQRYLVRLNENGTVDPTFNTGSGPDQRIMDIALQQDGKLLALGYFQSFNGQ